MVAQGDLPAVAPPDQNRVVANDNLSLGMGDGELDIVDSLQEDAGAGPGVRGGRDFPVGNLWRVIDGGTGKA